MGGGKGSFGGGFGGTEEEDSDLYGLDTVTVASVIPQEQMRLTVTVDELDIGALYRGQTAVVTVDALNGRSFTAQIEEIASAGESDGGNSKFTLTLVLDKEADMLPNMNAAVAVVTETISGVPSVPVAALTEQDGKTLLYLGYDEETASFTDPVEVTLGASDGEYVQILSGITTGQTFFYPYYDTLEVSFAPNASGGFPFG